MPHTRNARAKLLALTVALAAAPCALAAEDGLQAASTAPLPVLLADRLLEEDLGYKVTISMGQDMTGDAELTLAEGTLESDATQAVWRIAYREKGVVSRGELYVLRQDDLALLERRVSMPAIPDMVMRFRTDSVVLTGLGNASSEEIGLSQPVLANLDVSVLALPLAEGYETLARTFEAVHETAHWRIAVVGSEAVQTPAGTFESYKVALTCLDNDSFSATTWVTKEAPYRIVRRESAAVRELGQGRMVMELARIGSAAQE